MKHVLLAALTLAATTATAQEAAIGPDAWRALTEGKTLYYYKDGELYGREYFGPGDRVVFRFPNGACTEGAWAYAEEKFCFAYAGQLHCFSHWMRDGEIVVRSIDDPEEEQTVEKIADNEPLTCDEAVDS